VVFDLNYAQAMMIQFAFFTAYFVVSLPSSQIVRRSDTRTASSSAWWWWGSAGLAFYPAAAVPARTRIFLLARHPGFGYHAAASGGQSLRGHSGQAGNRIRSLDLTQALNSLGTTLAPFFGSALILATVAKSADELRPWRPPPARPIELAEAASVPKTLCGPGHHALHPGRCHRLVETSQDQRQR